MSVLIHGLSDKAINGIIKHKVAEWLASIDDAELRTYLGDKIIVAGGALASLLTGEPVNDYDVYLTTRDAAARLAQYYLKRFAANPPKSKVGKVRMWVDTSEENRVKIVVKSAGVVSADSDKAEYEYFESAPADGTVDYVDAVTEPLRDADEVALRASVMDGLADGTLDPEAHRDELTGLVEQIAADLEPPKATGEGAKAKNRYRPLFISSNAITLSDRIQVVIRFFGPPEEILRNFDFVHCTNYWTNSGGDPVVTNEPALKALMNRKLRYVGSRYPICSIIRTRKFGARDFGMSAGVFIKMIWQCHQLDLDDIDVWQEQLTGVDAAYFAEIIAILKADKATGKQVDGAYVVALIDKMMD